MKALAPVLVLLPVFGFAADVTGRIGDRDIDQLPNAAARLLSIGPELEVRTSAIRQGGVFDFPAVSPGSFLLEIKLDEGRIFLGVVRVANEEMDAGVFQAHIMVCNPADCIADDFGIRPAHPPPRILDVCTALKDQARMFGDKFVIVGSLKETAAGPMLVGHCRKHFATSRYLWMTAIGLPGFAMAGALDFSQVPDWDKLKEPDKQISRIAAAARKHAEGSDKRVVAVYGYLLHEVGVEPARCKDHACKADIQYAPMDLVDIRGIRELN